MAPAVGITGEPQPEIAALIAAGLDARRRARRRCGGGGHRDGPRRACGATVVAWTRRRRRSELARADRAARRGLTNAAFGSPPTSSDFGSYDGQFGTIIDSTLFPRCRSSCATATSVRSRAAAPRRVILRLVFDKTGMPGDSRSTPSTRRTACRGQPVLDHRRDPASTARIHALGAVTAAAERLVCPRPVGATTRCSNGSAAGRQPVGPA